MGECLLGRRGDHWFDTGCLYVDISEEDGVMYIECPFCNDTKLAMCGPSYCDHFEKRSCVDTIRMNERTCPPCSYCTVPEIELDLEGKETLRRAARVSKGMADEEGRRDGKIE